MRCWYFHLFKLQGVIKQNCFSAQIWNFITDELLINTFRTQHFYVTIFPGQITPYCYEFLIVHSLKKIP